MFVFLVLCINNTYNLMLVVFESKFALTDISRRIWFILWKRVSKWRVFFKFYFSIFNDWGVLYWQPKFSANCQVVKLFKRDTEHTCHYNVNKASAMFFVYISCISREIFNFLCFYFQFLSFILVYSHTL